MIQRSLAVYQVIGWQFNAPHFSARMEAPVLQIFFANAAAVPM